MGNLVVVEAVATEPEAELICSLLHGVGIQCLQRQTTFGAGATDGLPVGGPREVVVRAEDLEHARETLKLQRR